MAEQEVHRSWSSASPQEKLEEAERRIAEARSTGAEELELGDIGILELPRSLSDLPHLREFRVSIFALQLLAGSISHVSDLAPLAGLTGLERLMLRSCYRGKDLSPLANLKELQILCLGSNAVKDLSPLAGLTRLRELDLGSCPGVTDLSPLAGLRELRDLDLDSCRCTDLAPLAGLQSLETLNLTSCQGIADLSPLAGLRNLRKLYLTGCRPATFELLQALVELPHLSDLTLDRATGIPREVLSQGRGDNCLPRLRSYFSEMSLGAEAENEVKVILLGNSRAGKTQLCRRFRGQPFDPAVESTHGVQLWREQLRIRTGGEEQVFQANWWDFGGQDIYHETHALFLRSRAVFLILWTPTLENRDEYSEGGISMRNQPLAYWLEYVRSQAGEASPVIVVQSQCDRFEDRRPGPAAPKGLGFFASCCYSAKEDLGREVLEAHLREAIGFLAVQNGALRIGQGPATVRRQLYAWRSEDQLQRPAERRHRTLTLEEFRALCDSSGGISSWEHALSYFHDTGVVFYDPYLFSNCIVLDQDWALEGVYTIFRVGRLMPWLRDSGRFTSEDLALTVWRDYSVAEQRLFLGLMESCGVCFHLGYAAGGEERYLALHLLSKVAPRLEAWRDEESTATLRLQYPFFHQAPVRSLMRKVLQRAGERAVYWNLGLWFKDDSRDTQLLAQVLDTGTDAAPGAGALELKAQGRDPLGLLLELRREVAGERDGKRPVELLTFEGTTVSREALASTIDGRVLDCAQRPTDAALFAAFFEGREVVMEELLASPETKQRVRELEEPSAVVLDNESKDRALVGEVISIVAHAGQICREKNVSDHGIDMEIEFKDDDHAATGQMVLLQLKSGDAYLRKRKRDGAEVFTVKKERHARYWMAQKFPVLLVIRNSAGEVRWMEIREWLRRESDNGKKPVKQIVFKGERLDVMSVLRWRDRYCARVYRRG